MTRMLVLNLPVDDLRTSMRCFTTRGFAFDERFADVVMWMSEQAIADRPRDMQSAS